MSCYIDVPRQLIEAYPDAVAFDVVGDCMEPDIWEDQTIIVSPGVKPTVGAVAAFDYGRSMPNLACIERLEQGYTVLRNNLGRSYYIDPGKVLGVVVAVI